MKYSRNLVCTFTAHHFERWCVCVYVHVSLHTHNDGYSVCNYIFRAVVAIGNVKFNHFDYCFRKLSLGYTVMINHNPVSQQPPATQVSLFPVSHVSSCRSLWLCSEPLFTSQLSFKNQRLLNLMMKRKETASKPYRNLKASV